MNCNVIPASLSMDSTEYRWLEGLLPSSMVTCDCEPTAYRQCWGSSDKQTFSSWYGNFTERILKVEIRFIQMKYHHHDMLIKLTVFNLNGSHIWRTASVDKLASSLFQRNFITGILAWNQEITRSDFRQWLYYLHLVGDYIELLCTAYLIFFY